MEIYWQRQFLKKSSRICGTDKIYSSKYLKCGTEEIYFRLNLIQDIQILNYLGKLLLKIYYIYFCLFFSFKKDSMILKDVNPLKLRIMILNILFKIYRELWTDTPTSLHWNVPYKGDSYTSFILRVSFWTKIKFKTLVNMPINTKGRNIGI